MRLTEENKFNFMKNIMAWMHSTNVLETESCFALNFGYKGFLPLPQIYEA